jgi:hypothetical protein
MSAQDEIEQLAHETEARHFLIRWLAQEDSSVYGECNGKDFDALLFLDLVTKPVAPAGRPIEYARVSLTDKGYALAHFLRHQQDVLAEARP